MERSDPFQELFPCCDEYDLPFFSGSNDNGEENTGNQASVSSVTLVAESEVPLRDTLSGEALTPVTQRAAAPASPGARTPSRETAQANTLWSHVTLISEKGDETANKVKVCKCNHCKQEIKVFSVSNIRSHLTGSKHLPVDVSQPFSKEKKKISILSKIGKPIDRYSYENVVIGGDRIVMNFATLCRPFIQVEHETTKKYNSDGRKFEINDRHKLRDRTVEYSPILLKKRLDLFKGQECTLAVDGGTVHRKYLGCTLCFEGTRPILFELKNYENLKIKEGDDEGKVTSEAIGLTLRSIRDDLQHNYDITVTAVVADNAAVMQAGQATIPGTLHVRCAAHIINLVAQDLKKLTWISDVHDKAVAIAQSAKVKLPKMILTRWNWLLRLIIAILKKASIPNSGIALSDDDTAEFERAVQNLRPLLTLTDALQCDTATLWDGFVAFSALLHCSGTDSDFGNLVSVSIQKDLRECMFQQDYMVLLMFLAPGCRRWEIKRDIIERVESVLTNAMSLFPPSATPHHIRSELRNLQSAGADKHIGNITKEIYLEYWNSAAKKYPNLCCCVVSLLKIAPSEASVERIFSILKHTFTDNRTNAMDIAIFSQIQLKTVYENWWVAGKKRLREEDDGYFDDEDAESIVGVSCVSGAMMLTLLDYFNSGVVIRRLKIQPTSTCKYCTKPTYNHDDQRVVVCCICKGRVAVECVGCAYENRDSLASCKTWDCRDCVYQI